MQKLSRHRPHREFPQAKRLIIECDLEVCPICGSMLKPRLPWHTRKTIQTLQGPLFVAGKSKECANPSCRNYQKHYYASRVWLYSLPNSSYGLDVLAFIGWQHEHEHHQLVEIQRELNRRGIAINERNVGKLVPPLSGFAGCFQPVGVLQTGSDSQAVWGLDLGDGRPAAGRRWDAVVRALRSVERETGGSSAKRTCFRTGTGRVAKALHRPPVCRCWRLYRMVKLLWWLR